MNIKQSNNETIEQLYKNKSPELFEACNLFSI